MIMPEPGTAPVLKLLTCSVLIVLTVSNVTGKQIQLSKLTCQRFFFFCTVSQFKCTAYVYLITGTENDSELSI